MQDRKDRQISLIRFVRLVSLVRSIIARPEALWQSSVASEAWQSHPVFYIKGTTGRVGEWETGGRITD